MELSAAGLDLIKHSEGFRAHVYKDVNGISTIGYGHKLLQEGSFAEGIDESTACHILACDVDDAKEALLRLVKVPLSQGQFDALVDFVYNLGEGRLATSTLLAELNAGHYDAAAGQLLRWDRAAGKVIDGLKARREAEFDLWHGGPEDAPAKEAAA